MISFFDTHAHLDDPCFAPDLPQVIERALASGVAKILTIGTDLESSRRAVQLAEAHECIYAGVGWHPNHAMEAPDDLRPALRLLARHPKVVAIGETGIDYYRLPGRQGGNADEDGPFRRRQADLFRQQLEVAAETGLNCVVHQREAFEETLEILSPFAGSVRAVFHCFAGDPAALRRVLETGGLVSFTGILTFKNGQNIRDALAAAPMDGFMLETDCPYLAPVPHRGRRCEPAHLVETAAVAARVKGCSPEALGAATCATAAAFFPKMG